MGSDQSQEVEWDSDKEKEREIIFNVSEYFFGSRVKEALSGQDGEFRYSKLLDIVVKHLKDKDKNAQKVLRPRIERFTAEILNSAVFSLDHGFLVGMVNVAKPQITQNVKAYLDAADRTLRGEQGPATATVTAATPTERPGPPGLNRTSRSRRRRVASRRRATTSIKKVGDILNSEFFADWFGPVAIWSTAAGFAFAEWSSKAILLLKGSQAGKVATNIMEFAEIIFPGVTQDLKSVHVLVTKGVELVSEVSRGHPITNTIADKLDEHAPLVKGANFAAKIDFTGTVATQIQSKTEKSVDALIKMMENLNLGDAK